MKYTIRFIARFVVESVTPLGIGSGESGLVNDRLVVRDANGLPYIPGTSLAGVIRHELEEKTSYKLRVNEVFGFQNQEAGQDDEEAIKGKGSRIFFSDAVMIAADGRTALEGLQKINFEEDYYRIARRLPERDHVKINHKGTAVKHGKYEEEYVFKGTRFTFEIELAGTEEDSAVWEEILRILGSASFRIGAGTRKGFGQLDIVSCKTRYFDLGKEKSLEAYLEHGSSLNADVSGTEWKEHFFNGGVLEGWIHYPMKLKPESFFFFGAGYGDEEVSMLPKREAYFSWKSGSPELVEGEILIPATSVKGALSHRVAFHYNRLTNTSIENTGNFDPEKEGVKFSWQEALDSIIPGYDLNGLDMPADSEQWQALINEVESISIDNSVYWHAFLEQLESLENEENLEGLPVGEHNVAVKELFGYAKDTGKEEGSRGRIILSDIFLDKAKDKVLNHVKIDRFTGGAIDGALFQERVVTTENPIEFDIYVEQEALTDRKIKEAFEEALKDLEEGRLQLGGNTTKGHGVFQSVKD